MSIGTVDGRPVPVGALEDRLAAMYTSRAAGTLPAQGSGERRRVRRWVAQLLLTEELVRAEARSLGVTGGADVVIGPATTGSLSAAVLANLPLARALLHRVTADVAVTDEDVRAYYERNPDRWARPARVQLRHVLAADEEAAATADPARGEVWDRAVADLPRPLAAAVLAATPGEVIGPVRSPFGWHIAQVLTLTPAGRAGAEEMRGAIGGELADAARAEFFDRWLERRRREIVVVEPGFEHPGDPTQPDFSHHH